MIQVPRPSTLGGAQLGFTCPLEHPYSLSMFVSPPFELLLGLALLVFLQRQATLHMEKEAMERGIVGAELREEGG